MVTNEVRDFSDTMGSMRKHDPMRLPIDWKWLFRHHELPPTVRITYAYIVGQTDLDGSCSVPLENIGQALGISYATIHKHIKDLERRGYLRVERRPSSRNTYFPLHTVLL